MLKHQGFNQNVKKQINWQSYCQQQNTYYYLHKSAMSQINNLLSIESGPYKYEKKML